MSLYGWFQLLNSWLLTKNPMCFLTCYNSAIWQKISLLIDIVFLFLKGCSTNQRNFCQSQKRWQRVSNLCKSLELLKADFEEKMFEWASTSSRFNIFNINIDREHRELLEKCAATTLSSKLVAHQKDFFAKMVVDAVMHLDELLPLNMIGVKKVTGGALEVS